MKDKHGKEWRLADRWTGSHLLRISAIETAQEALNKRDPELIAALIQADKEHTIDVWLRRKWAPRIRYHHFGNRVTIRSEELGGAKAKISIAICAKDDQFCRRTGRELCDDRAAMGEWMEVENGKKFIEYWRDCLQYRKAGYVVRSIQKLITEARDNARSKQPSYMPPKMADWLNARRLVALPEGSCGGPGISGWCPTQADPAPTGSLSGGWPASAYHTSKSTMILWKDREGEKE